MFSVSVIQLLDRVQLVGCHDKDAVDWEFLLRQTSLYSTSRVPVRRLEAYLRNLYFQDASDNLILSSKSTSWPVTEKMISSSWSMT